jgi:hypothetical protein
VLQQMMQTFVAEDNNPPLYTSDTYVSQGPLLSRILCAPATSASMEKVFYKMANHATKLRQDGRHNAEVVRLSKVQCLLVFQSMFSLSIFERS